MRRILLVVAALAAFLTASGTALGHAYLVSSTPAKDAKVQTAPDVLLMNFNEPIELLNLGDADVVDEDGQPVSAGAARRGTDTRQLQIPLQPGLPDGTYTVRYKVIGADSHIIPGVWVFGVGDGELGPPWFEGDGSGGPSETSAWGTSSRFLEIVGLGGLIGLLAFRWLVWAPAVRGGRDVSDADRTAALTWGRDAFWVGFGVLALGAMLAEGYLLVVHTAGVLGTDVLSALRDATGISQVLGDTRFGSLVQLRGALLFGLFAIGAILFIREYGGAGTPKAATASGPPWAAVLMAALLLSVLGGIAAQGHASVADWAAVQIGAHLVHVVAVAVWLTGLALVAIVHVRLPKVAPGGGPALAARVLTRFSAVASVAVAVAIASGLVRTLGELDDPAQLWGSDYGQSILWKLALLVPIAVIALYNRRIVAALARVRRPNAPTLRLVRRTASAELALALVIVLIATVLVAQVPAGA
ncbi:copper resistance protein CopC [Miltoncostaea marina]|uniref:copper resistance CopC/CopD family protein n=1 Tax=Miltoncostaea marina TaxID=2843215 RepID=UPI001C3CED05|nr:copper resistance protein CopC [Miltoncostaea marina]